MDECFSTYMHRTRILLGGGLSMCINYNNRVIGVIAATINLATSMNNEYDALFLDPKVWGPPTWFFLHMVARTYPLQPTSITKKRYYDFFQVQMPLFLPSKHTKAYETFLNELPVVPYLDTRDHLIHWVYLLHNRVNQSLEKPLISFEEAHVAAITHAQKVADPIHTRKSLRYVLKQLCFVCILCVLVYYIYLFVS